MLKSHIYKANYRLIAGVINTFLFLIIFSCVNADCRKWKESGYFDPYAACVNIYYDIK